MPAHRLTGVKIFRRILLTITLALTLTSSVPTAVVFSPLFDDSSMAAIASTKQQHRFDLVRHLPPVQATIGTVSTTPPRVHVLGYSRDEFGHGWASARACTTRELVIAVSIPGARLNKKTCQLDGGSSVDPYSGDHITSRSALELDHVIPLSAAWDLGAFAWSEQKRIAFANDPLNLVIVSKQQNQAKSDHLPNEWLPPNRWARCWYARRVSAVASSYGLPLPEADKNTLKKQCIIRDFLQMSLE